MHPKTRAARWLSLAGAAVLLFACKRAPTDNRESEAPRAVAWLQTNVVRQESESDEAWDVDAPTGPHRQIEIDVRRGTWMSVDVSPDGGTLVFDLLGDLYTLPITGGEARSLTHGHAWDMQPRFSPDGRWIAFTSDRGGGDNIWLVASEGGKPIRVTREDFRLVNSPTWSPDGQFIVVRKHFTAERSLGAGEIWLYHRSGGEGVALTQRANQEKDVGEPAFSPDGRFIYYSKDATPGERFEYNKNPHAGVYVIERLDRETGVITTIADGPGGAIRPTPSPDGHKLAFVRRVGLKTVAMVRDLTSGTTSQVFDGLDRDMQETWAIHGVYPAMAWTPDARELVLWAGGGLHAIEVATRRVRAIDFHVKDERTVVEALRFPVDVQPATAHTKMLRGVRVAPDGNFVVYQALGNVYGEQLSSHTARRLTKVTDEFEFFPSFSPDGDRIVYVAWNDDRLGQVRTLNLRSGQVRNVTSEPGHYADPCFVPDGSAIVYVKRRGGDLLAPQWSNDPGVYRIGSEGKPVRISRAGERPHFGADPRRVFLVEEGRHDEHSVLLLKSVALSGADERMHFRGRHATDYRVAPDGRHVAFRERFHAWVMPFVFPGKLTDLDVDSEALPMARLSHDGADNLQWSRDGQRLYWSLGPQLFTRSLAEAFAFVPGSSDTERASAAPAVQIGFDFQLARPDTSYALIGAKILTMRGEHIIEDGVVVVERDRITQVGRRDEVRIPAGAEQMDVRGKTIMPGLIDVHAHGPQAQGGITPQRNWHDYATLAFGVTTIHDPSNDTESVFAASELAKAGRVVAPRIFSTGTILYGAEAPDRAHVDSLEAARSHMRRMQAVGGFSVKSYNQPRRDQRQRILAAAREQRMMVVPEGGSLLQLDLTMIVDGHTGIEHAIPVARAYEDVRQLWSQTSVGYTPTLVVGFGGLFGENYWYANSDVFAHERLRRFVPPHELDARARRRVLASEGDWNHVALAQTAHELAKAGVSVQLGAHGQLDGLAAHWELWMLVQGGMRPLEALRAGTLRGAAYLGLERDLGSIEVGKLADLVVIDGDPSSDIRTSERVEWVLINGRLFDAKTMREPGRGEMPRFHWQAEAKSTK